MQSNVKVTYIHVWFSLGPFSLGPFSLGLFSLMSAHLLYGLLYVLMLHKLGFLHNV
jgi:hypothetical protein